MTIDLTSIANAVIALIAAIINRLRDPVDQKQDDRRTV